MWIWTKEICFVLMGVLPPYFPETRSCSVRSVRFSLALSYVRLRKMLHELPGSCPQLLLQLIKAALTHSLLPTHTLDFQKTIYLNTIFGALDWFSSLRFIKCWEWFPFKGGTPGMMFKVYLDSQSLCFPNGPLAAYVDTHLHLKPGVF